MLKRLYNMVIYSFALLMVFVLSWVLGQKNSDQYSIITTIPHAKADSPHGGDGGGGDAGGDAGGDGASGDAAAGGVDAAGPGVGGVGDASGTA